ncbi:quaternary amine ABC transporter ATP-binding protein [Maridesulfovibrio salexigens]|uniref:Glycine betaine/L-proline ABC transporter, ATPase subunit n=1 Tax=Maridesulfovibrio salexigens (strain ATCC 14822 / DSM 2638 / NCIMB 8403 / VKM B-1763) TaxID=526222 RepID=C6BYF1_MARSD|nr:glycine betaine/L-proline ABC transporter ATP-binding protein [Maridesulfovibrio salexigens]ACS78742.1 glycine betaine/L-proline ABC transporter, ATPase subunit [Maridesulfovibrio salexigens DSM 2638]
MEKIRVENLYKIFGNAPKKIIPMLEQGDTKDEIMEKTKHGVGVNNASFSVEEGEIVVVMGLSGSGKSTLVRCINRLIDPTGGKIFIDGEDITTLSKSKLRKVRLEKLGMVFQNFALFPHRTVLKNTEYGLEIADTDAETRKQKAMEALELVGLAGWENSYPDQLSGGMRQRVGLARALALDPDILLMDEAFSALDPLIRRDMQDELINLQERMHKTIVFISHDLDEALKLGDRIVLMKDGEIVQVGTPEEILTEPATEYVRRFVEDVDITKVLTAESVMKKIDAVAYLKTDGPRASLRKMRKNNISNLFVLDEKHKLIGMLNAGDCAKLVEEGGKDIRTIMHTDLQAVDLECPAQELFNIMQDRTLPLPVINSEKKLKGVIVRGTLIGALAERGGN